MMMIIHLDLVVICEVNYTFIFCPVKGTIAMKKSIINMTPKHKIIVTVMTTNLKKKKNYVMLVVPSVL